MMRKSYQIVQMNQMGGNGNGAATMQHWLTGEDLVPNLNMAGTLRLPPGGTVSDHVHQGEAEIYRILAGKGDYNDNGTRIHVKEDDVLVCHDGETHGLINTGEEDLVFDAVIIKG
jgi:mannose-6-phosphate isomerase-like protein (cupin superfamily)